MYWLIKIVFYTVVYFSLIGKQISGFNNNNNINSVTIGSVRRCKDFLVEVCCHLLTVG
jgi:hypothetical protein